MIKRVALVLLAISGFAVAALVGLFLLATVLPSRTPGLTSWQDSSVEEAVKQGLRDPDSARFGRKAAIVDKRGVMTVCGFVSARNGFGGYSDMHPFIVLGTKGSASFFPPAIGNSDGADHQVLYMCAKAGILFSSD